MSRGTTETDYLVQEFPELPYDRYKIVQNIGKGAFSIVYLAYTPEYHRRAIKRIRLTSKPNQLMREIEFLRKLEGKENIVQVKEIRFSPTVSQTSVITNFCDSDDFKAVIYDYTPRDIHNYMKALLTSLAHCERANILHRDVKPGNFLHVKATNEALLIDFGLAQTVREAEEFPIIRNRSKRRIPLGRPTRKPGDLPYCGPTNREQSKFQPLAPQPHSGTHGYRAPEILHAVSSQGPKIDTWSAGVIMIQMLTGKTSLFRGTPTTDLYELTAIRAIIGTDRFIQGSGLLGADFSLTAGTPNPQHIPLEELTAVLNPDLFIVLPPAAYDLCRRLLAFDPAHRLSATEALKHPFLNCESLSIPNLRRHPPDLELSNDINCYKTNIMRKARGIVLRAGIPLDTAMNISEEYTSAVPHTDLQALPKEHRKLVERLLFKYKDVYYRKEYENMLRYGVGLDRGYTYDGGTVTVSGGSNFEFGSHGEAGVFGGNGSMPSQAGNLSISGNSATGQGMFSNPRTYREIMGIPSNCGIYSLANFESIKLKPIDLVSAPGYAFTPCSSPTMASMSGRCSMNQQGSSSTNISAPISAEQEWMKFQQELEFNNRNKELYEAAVRFSSIRRRLDPWIVPLKFLDKELFLIQKKVREAAEDYRLAVIEMGVVTLDEDEDSFKPNPNNPGGVSDHERVIEKIIAMRARLGDYPCCDWMRDEIQNYKRKYGVERFNEITRGVTGFDMKSGNADNWSGENPAMESPHLSKGEVDLEKSIANTKLQVKVGIKEKLKTIEVNSDMVESAKIVNEEIKKRIYPSNYTIGNVNLVKVLTGLVKQCGGGSITDDDNKDNTIDFSNHAEASEVIRMKLDEIRDKEIGVKHRKDFNTSRNYAISKATRRHTIIYRNCVLRQLYNHRLRFTGISVFDSASLCTTQTGNKFQPLFGDSNSSTVAESNATQAAAETTSVFSLEETITASDDSNNIQHLQELGDNPVISNIITTNTNFPQINTISTSKTGTLTTSFEVPTISVHTSVEKERKYLEKNANLEVMTKDSANKCNAKQNGSKGKVNNLMNQQTTTRMMSMTIGGNSTLGGGGGNSDSDVFTRIEEFAKVIEQRKKDRKELRKSERLNKYTQSQTKAQEIFANPEKISEDDPIYENLLDDLEMLEKLSAEDVDKFGNNKKGVSHVTNVLTKPLSLYSTIERAVKKLITRGSYNPDGEGINSNRGLFIKYNKDGSIRSVYGSTNGSKKTEEKPIGGRGSAAQKKETEEIKASDDSNTCKLEKTKALAGTISSIVGLRASLINAQSMRQQLDEGMGVTSGMVFAGVNGFVPNSVDTSNTEDATGSTGRAGALGLAFQTFQGGLGTGGIAKYMVPIRQIVLTILGAIENGGYNVEQGSEFYSIYFDIPIVFKVLISLVEKNESAMGITKDGSTISGYLSWMTDQICGYVDSYITSATVTASPRTQPTGLQIIANPCTTCSDLINILRRIQCDLDRESVYGTLGQNNIQQLIGNLVDTGTAGRGDSKASAPQDQAARNEAQQNSLQHDSPHIGDVSGRYNTTGAENSSKADKNSDKGNSEAGNALSPAFDEDTSMKKLWKMLLGENSATEEASKFINFIIQGFVREVSRGSSQKPKINQPRWGRRHQDCFAADTEMDDASLSQVTQGGAGLIVPPRPPCLETLLTIPKGALLLPITNTMFGGNGAAVSTTIQASPEAGCVLGYTNSSLGISGFGSSAGLSINGIANSFIDAMASSIIPVAKPQCYFGMPPPMYGRTTSRSRPSRVLQDAGRVPPRMMSLGGEFLNRLIEQATSHLFKLSPLAISDLARECACCVLAIRCRLLVGRLSRIWRETCIEVDSLQSSKNGYLTNASTLVALRIRRMRVRWISCVIRAMGRFGPAGVLAILRGVAQAGTTPREANYLNEVLEKNSRVSINKLSPLEISNFMTKSIEASVNPSTPAMKEIKKIQKSAGGWQASRRARFESGLMANQLRQRISAMKPRRL